MNREKVIVKIPNVGTQVLPIVFQRKKKKNKSFDQRKFSKVLTIQCTKIETLFFN